MLIVCKPPAHSGTSSEPDATVLARRDRDVKSAAVFIDVALAFLQMTRKMKTLTLTQPWATLVALGAKTIETRNWRTDYRGLLAIHAAKSFPVWARDTCRLGAFDRVLRAAGIYSWHELPVGAVLATSRLIACDSIDPMFAELPDDPQERAFGDFSYGRFMWKLAEINPLPQPVPARGSLGLWDWNPPPE